MTEHDEQLRQVHGWSSLKNAGRETADTHDALAVARTALDGAIGDERRHIRRRRALISGALVAVISGLTVGIWIVRPSSGDPVSRSATTLASAPEVLTQLGAAASGRAPGGRSNATYWHTVYLRSGDLTGDVKIESWSGHGSTGVEQIGHNPPTRTPPATYAVGDDQLSWQELYALPTDPKALAQRFTGNSCESLAQIAALLQFSPAPPALRGSLYEAAAALPGLRAIGSATDATGRTGQAITCDAAGIDVTVVGDPADGTLLEQRVTKVVDPSELRPVGDTTVVITLLHAAPTDRAAAP